ncbi:hypothetical protein BOO69_08535 [Sulfitobacter alexandrii]|uniref:Uncharacterized protein n=1 Tax=Sulfitobacter alexandrii TaxID=1917485 RepID=A0A1J0WGL6_9RHOB|nr:hypothetical protein [Sulfitobacter alexandrii]APE43457.1 hypothetical protein BOO69_08535 [Sulfitobacter alexandrii]
MTRLAVAGAVGMALLGLPQAAVACAQLSQDVWMCDRGTPWETATWDQYGDGATLLLDDYVLDFTQEWPGHEITDGVSTLEELFATYNAWAAAEAEAPANLLQSDRMNLPHATVVRHIQRDLWEGEPYLQAVMLAQVSDARIMLWLQAPNETPVEDLDLASREVASLLRDDCADPVSCAEDYEPPETASKE